MELFESSYDVDDDLPYVILIEVLLLFLLLGDLVVEVAVVCKLHHDAGLRLAYHRLLPYRKAYL